MSLRKEWERLAFGNNSSGKKSGLLREFRDTYEDFEVEPIVDPVTGSMTPPGGVDSMEDDGPQEVDPETIIVYTLDGLEQAAIAHIPAQEYDKYLQKIQSLPNLSGMDSSGGIGNSAKALPTTQPGDNKPSTMDESTFRGLRRFLSPRDPVWSLLKENGTWGGPGNPTQGGGLLNGNMGGNARNHGGLKGVCYTLDAMFGGQGGNSITIEPREANLHGSGITFDITPVHASWTYPVDNPEVNCFPGGGGWNLIGAIAGGDDAACCAIEDYWTGGNSCQPPYQKSSVWGAANSHPDVKYDGVDYELKGATSAKNLTWEASTGDWEKDFKYQLECTSSGVSSGKKGKTIAQLAQGAVGKGANPMTKHLVQNLLTSNKELSLLFDYKGNASDSWCTGKTNDEKQAEAKKVKDKIANYLKTPAGSAAMWPLWKKAEGVSGSSVSQYILCVQYATGDIGVIPPSQYTGSTPPGAWKVSLYNGSSCRPMLGFAFTPYTGASCTAGALDDLLGY